MRDYVVCKAVTRGIIGTSTCQDLAYYEFVHDEQNDYTSDYVHQCPRLPSLILYRAAQARCRIGEGIAERVERVGLQHSISICEAYRLEDHELCHQALYSDYGSRYGCLS